MSRNLNNILRSDIFHSFSEGRDKHAAKRSGCDQENDTKIWSYSQRRELLDITKNLCMYMKENYPEIRRKEDLTTYHTERWLESKAAEGVTQATINTYSAAIRKIGKIAGIELNPEKITALTRKRADRGAGSVVSTEDYHKIIDYCEKHPSGSASAIRLERLLGVRVSDLAYGVTITDQEIRIQSKGGKECVRRVTPELRKLLSSPEISRCMRNDGKMILPKDDSINKFLRRTEDRLGLERHSFHDLRRYRAQEIYDQYRKGGMTRQQALSSVGMWLNHGPHREKLVLESYLQNAW